MDGSLSIMAHWVDRVDQVVATVFVNQKKLIDAANVIVIEMPRIYSRGSAQSQAAKNSGAITKLIFLVATLRSRIDEHRSVRIVLVYPQIWKGQVSKKITRSRMVRRYGNIVKSLDHNIVDAIGIGTWLLGKV
jgi:hypothetical protein